MPSGRKRTILVAQCQWCGPTGKCRSCEQAYQAAVKEHRAAYNRKKYLEQKAEYDALGLNRRGRTKSAGWKGGPSLVLNQKLTPIPDEECFEAPTLLTTRELKFLI